MESAITITIDEYNELVEDSKFLSCLRAAGVDNWEGYEHACDIMNEDD